MRELKLEELDVVAGGWDTGWDGGGDGGGSDPGSPPVDDPYDGEDTSGLNLGLNGRPFYVVNRTFDEVHSVGSYDSTPDLFSDPTYGEAWNIDPEWQEEMTRFQQETNVYISAPVDISDFNRRLYQGVGSTSVTWTTSVMASDPAQQEAGEPFRLDGLVIDAITHTIYLPHNVGDGYGNPPPGFDMNYVAQQELYNAFDSVVGLSPPDNAIYMLPNGFDAEIIEAINYLRSLDPVARLVEFKNMYTDASHPHFIDIKQMGGPTLTYFSDVTQQTRTVNAFEPMGNFLFGFIGTLGGISFTELASGAAYFQARPDMNNEFWDRFFNMFVHGDDAADVGHVNYGIIMAKQYEIHHTVAFSIER